MKKILDVMNKDVISIQRDTTVEEIVRIMKEKKIGKIPVVEEGKVLGVITREDLLVKEEVAPVQPVIAFWEVLITLPSNREFEKKLEKLTAYKAEQIMNRDFYSCSSEESLEKIVTEMLECKHDYTLVIDNGNLVGIVTKSDLISKCF
ncbi:MAG: CBS domain-containing protein [Fusobacteriaceae bacterium]